MKIFDFISGIFQPAADLIDNVHTSEEEKLQVRQAMFAAQTQATIRILEMEKDIVEMQASVIKAETQSDSWLTRSWRPLIMIMFGGMMLSLFFGYTPDFDSPEMLEKVVDWIFRIIYFGLGGYVVGRSGEKVIPKAIDAWKESKNG